MDGNSTYLMANKNISNSIVFKRGVFQGSAIPPDLFNLSIGFILKDLSDEKISSLFGYEVKNDLPKLSVMGFVDDTCIIRKDRSSASQLIQMAMSLFQEIRLNINVRKSIAINIHQGILVEDDLIVFGDTTIRSIQATENVRYLGVNFHEEIVVDVKQLLQKFQKSLELIVSTPMLHPDQKIQILNEFI
jgi:hypothetical protein